MPMQWESRANGKRFIGFEGGIQHAVIEWDVSSNKYFAAVMLGGVVHPVGQFKDPDQAKGACWRLFCFLLDELLNRD